MRCQASNTLCIGNCRDIAARGNSAVRFTGAPTKPDSGYVEGVKEFYSGPVIVGRDLMEF
jgi:hypothetical protein